MNFVDCNNRLMLCTIFTYHNMYAIDLIFVVSTCLTSRFICLLIKSSIVVTGVPTKSYRLPSNWIKENTTVVNVASFKNVDEDEILQIPGVSKYLAVGTCTQSFHVDCVAKINLDLLSSPRSLYPNGR